MESAFSITTTTNAISLDAAGRSAAVFTVNNQTGRSVRVRTDVSPFPPTPPAWFSIEGASERLYPPGGAEAVTVLVAAGAAPPPGRYAFRLDALSVDRPDEEWAHGPSVGFEVAVPPEPAEPPPPTVRRGYLETVLGALAGGLLAIVLSVIIGADRRAIVFNGFPAAAIVLRLYLVGGLTLGVRPRGRDRRGGRARGPGHRRFGPVADRSRLRGRSPSPDPDGPPGRPLHGHPRSAIGRSATFAVTILVTLSLIVPAALAGRAYARFRAGGKL